MRDKPKVGQVLYSLNVGNAARNRKQVLTPVTVKKVGRKYFTAGDPDKPWGDTQFHISDWKEKSKYSASHHLFEREQDWLDEKEAGEIVKQIRDAFDWRSPQLPLGVLRQIRDLLNT